MGGMRKPAIPLAVGGLVAAAVLLAGCVPQQTAPSGPPSTSESSAPATTEASPSETPTRTPTPTPTDSPAVPIQVDCTQVLPLDALYAYNPNVSAFAAAAPANSLAAQATADQGTVCEVVHNSNGSTMYVSVSQPSGTELAADQAAAGSAITVTGAQGYASDAGVQAFVGQRRYTAEGSGYFDQDQLVSVIEIAIAAG